jgi:hypothetical protein
MAARQAGKNAHRLVDHAVKMKSVSHQHVAATMAPPAPIASTAKETAAPATVLPTAFGAAMTAEVPHAVDDHDPRYEKQSYARRRFGTPIEFITGPFLRSVLGLLLLAAFAQWWTSGRVDTIAAQGQKLLATKRTDAADLVLEGKGKGAAVSGRASQSQQVERPFDVPLIPSRLTRPVGALPVLAAGGMLLIGACFRGRLFGAMMYLAAGVALFGHLTRLPSIGGQAALAVLTGAALWAFAVIFVREKRDA